MTTRLYLDFDVPCKGMLVTDIVLPRDETHYVHRVLRLSFGDSIHVFNATAGEWRCIISDVTKNHVTLRLKECVKSPCIEPVTCLVYAALKHDAMSILFEKATELGVTHFQPMMTDYAQKYNVQHDKVQRQLKQAVQQCERLRVPVLLPALRFDDVLVRYPNAYIALERSDSVPLIKALPTDNTCACTFIVGPEGGFSPREIALAEKSTVIPVSLGNTILRAETAAIVGLGVIHMGRLYTIHANSS
jgi:16S rRNA (uracil1498-N3)-methyltransferase